MQVERIPTLSDNYTYLVVDPATRQAAVIDAPEVDPVVRRIESLGVELVKILSTHHHWDHSGANAKLAERYGAPVFGHVSDAGRIPGFTDGLEEGDKVSVGQLEADVLFIPAHTRGHIAYVFPGAVFCGDTLFFAGCGRLFEGNPKMMHTALCEKLAALPDDTLVYCGHEYTESNLRFALSVEPGNEKLRETLARVEKIRAHRAADWHDATPDEMTVPSTLGLEREINPFMRVHSAEICARVKVDPSDPVAVLGAVRAAKDAF